MMKSTLIILILFCSVFLFPARAELQTGNLMIDDSVFKKKSEQGNVISLKGGGGGVMLLKPTRYNGASKLQIFQQVAGQFSKTKKWKPSEAITAHGYDVLYASEFIKSNGVRTYVIPVVIFSKDHFATLALIDVEYRGKDDLKKNFGALLASVRFTDNPTPVSEVGGSTPLDGFYGHIGAKVGIDAAAQTAVKVGAKGLWLKPDGRFALTETGMMGNMDSYCKKRRKNCGRYSIKNGQYTSWRVATTQQEYLQLIKRKTEAFKLNGKNFSIGKTDYKYYPPAKNLKLNGQYRTVNAGSRNDADGTTTNAFTQSVYGFLPDGRFFKGGYVANFSAGGGANVGVWGDQSRKIGQYNIDGYKLTLRYDKGNVEEKAFFMMDDVPVIEGSMYQKVK